MKSGQSIDLAAIVCRGGSETLPYDYVMRGAYPARLMRWVMAGKERGLVEIFYYLAHEGSIINGMGFQMG